MQPFLPYVAALLVVIAAYVALRPGPLMTRLLAIAGAAIAAWWLMAMVSGRLSLSGGDSGGVLFTLFALIAIASALRMVTHARPVYCALHFVLVVLASAGLLLLLEAEFIAFALIIVYAGAILITYMFVLMLAHQAGDGDDGDEEASHDGTPREPAAAVIVGALLLCLVTGAALRGTPELSPPAEGQAGWRQLENLPRQFETAVREADAAFAWPPQPDASGRLIREARGEAYVQSEDGTRLRLPQSALPRNTQHVGWTLVHDFPVNLELAGVILLMAMFGAVILARRYIEMADIEKRDAMKTGEAEA